MDVQTFIAAARSSGGNLLAWNDRISNGTRAILACHVDGSGRRVLSSHSVAEADVAAWNDAIAAAGLDIGGYSFLGPPWVWRVSPSRVTVWAADMLLLDAHEGVIALSYDRHIAAADIAGFLSYVEDDYVDRGVKARMHDGKLKTLLFHLDAGAASDITWSPLDMLGELVWCRTLAAALGAWAGVPVGETRS